LKFSFKKKISLDKNKDKIQLSKSFLNTHSPTEGTNEQHTDNPIEETGKDNKNNNNTSNNEKIIKDNPLSNKITKNIVDDNEDKKDNEEGLGVDEYICNRCKEKLDTEGKRPHWKWNFDRNLRFCKKCYKIQEVDYEKSVNYCVTCNSKLGFIRYNPKPKWKIKGQLCRKCWDNKNNKYEPKNKL
jgi:hypothetical protein